MAKTTLFFTMNTAKDAVAYQRALGLISSDDAITEEIDDGVLYFVNRDTGESFPQGSRFDVALKSSRKLASMN